MRRTQRRGYSKRRPDCCIYKETYNIIIEIDENQHKTQEYLEENDTRIYQIVNDFNGIPIIFIRFNPDNYKLKNGDKISSSFKYDKSLDILIIREYREWKNRLDKLKQTIEKYLTYEPQELMVKEELFYDEV